MNSYAESSQSKAGKNTFYKRKRQRLESTSENDEVKEYFNKRYVFKRDDTWIIPKSTGVYSEKKWNLEKFQQMKDELNEIKSRLGQFDLEEWSLHTKRRDPAGYIFRELKRHIKPELLTQAWCKFYECLCQFPVIHEAVTSHKKLNSLHLCEAPGAFISALNHYLESNYDGVKWHWMANTLNPEYEGNDLSQMIPDNRLINHTRDHWNFGLDNSGDITQHYNCQAIIAEAEKFDKLLLVTADGSVNCMSNPGEQESLVEHLHFCETFIALSVLSLGGSFVIKMFTLFESSSVCLLYFLNCCFSTVHIFKPCTSKSGNSEVYVICLNYKGKTTLTPILNKMAIQYKNPNSNISMFSYDIIPGSFISQVEECSDFFMKKQMKTINDNIYCFKKILPVEHRKCDYIKNAIGMYYLLQYKLKPISTFLCKSNEYYNNKSDNIFAQGNDISTNFMLHGTEFSENTEIYLDMLTGKLVTIVLYSEFCSRSFVEQLMNVHCTTAMQNISEEHTDVYDFILHIKFVSDNKIYTLHLLDELYDVINQIDCENSLLIVGSLYLTRLQAGLFYLLISCFSSIHFISSGVIGLKNATNKIYDIRKMFNVIKDQITDTSNKDCTNFEPFTLNILPHTFLQNRIFLQYLVYYNNSTIDHCTQSVTTS